MPSTADMQRYARFTKTKPYIKKSLAKTVSLFQSAYLRFSWEELVAEVALERFGDDVGHLLVLAQFAGRQELAIALVALEARVGAAMELGAVIVETVLRAQIADGNALVADVAARDYRLLLENSIIALFIVIILFRMDRTHWERIPELSITTFF